MAGIFNQYAGVVPGGANPVLGGSTSGALSQFEDLQKALQASNYQTDVATLTGGGSLGVQSLDTAMKTVIQENENFTLFNMLQSTNATNIVDEYVRQTGVGGVLGGSANSQMGVVQAAQGAYAREVGLVKFLMSLRQVGYVLNIGKNIIEATAVEERNGALQLLTDAEYMLFHGNAAACPVQFDGIFAQIDAQIAAGQMSSGNIYDMQGTKLNSVLPFSAINANVSGYGSWGKSTDAFLPQTIQLDLNTDLDPAYRWMPQGSNTPMIGGHVEAIRLTHGPMKTHMDTFLNDELNPMIVPWDGATDPNYTAAATANAAILPLGLTVAVNSDPSSTFNASRAGLYYWAVAAIDATGKGYSACVKSIQTTVAAGDNAVLTITRSAAATESGYVLYRSYQNGPNTSSTLRMFKVIPCAGATTTYTDENADIPGTFQVPLLNMGQAADAIGWRQFQPMTKIPLPFGVGGVPVISWFQFLFGYLRMTKPKHHGYIKNILPSKATWRPFTNE